MRAEEIQKKKNEQYRERHELAVERLEQIGTERTVPEEYLDYFQKTAAFLLKLENVRQMIVSGQWEQLSLEEMQKINRDLYSDITGADYKKSYGNPA